MTQNAQTGGTPNVGMSGPQTMTNGTTQVTNQEGAGGQSVTPTPTGGTPSSDPFTLAAQQQGNSSTQNINDQTVQNRANQVNSNGQLQWSQDPTTGQWTQTTSLNQPLQSALDSQQGITADRSGAASSMLPGAISSASQGLDTSGLNPLFSFGAPGQTNQQAQDAVMGQLQPGLDQSRKAAENQLSNQGITPGSEAWQNAERQLGVNDNNANLQATMAGFQQGNTENSQNIAYSQAQQAQNASNLSQQSTLNNYGLGQVNSLLNGQSVTDPSFGTYSQAGTATPTNYLGAQQSNYNAILDQQNADAAKNSSFDSGLFNLGGAFLGSNTGQSLLGSAGSFLGGLFG